MSNAVIVGKPSNTIGEKDSTLVLRGSSIKIQWGNKFIDLIKNGKINANVDKILKTADSAEEIVLDGIYLIGESVWAVIGGTKVQITGDSATYVSYLIEQKTTPEQKIQALTNIGFYYDTYEQAQNAGLTSGLIYVQGDNKLYIIKDGNLTEYINTSTKSNTNNITNEEKPIQSLYISDYSLAVDGEEYITYNAGTITNHKQLVLENGLESQGANSIYGYRLYTKYGQSYLEVDNLIVRNASESDKISIYPVKYFQEENIILSAVSQENNNWLQLTMLYSDKYKIGDILTTSILSDKQVEVTINGETEIITKQILVSIDFKIESIDSNICIVSTEIENIDDILPHLVNKSIFYKRGQLPVARIKDHNYDLFEANSEQELENINTRLGSISLIPIGDGLISDYSDIDLGIYSNNAFLENSRLFSSIQYNSEFRNLNNIYPKYEEGWYIPDDSDDQTIVTSLWVNNQLEPIKNEIDDIWEALDDAGGNTGGGTEGEDYSDDIANLQEQINVLNDTILDLNNTIVDLNNAINILYNGNFQNPVVLISGTLSRNGSTFIFTGNKKLEIETIEGTATEGQLKVACTVSGKSLHISGCQVTQYRTGYTANINTTNIREDGVGAHWFEARSSGNNIYIREFHQYNDANHTWASDTWTNTNGISAIYITVFGYLY